MWLEFPLKPVQVFNEYRTKGEHISCENANGMFFFNPAVHK